MSTTTTDVCPECYQFDCVCVSHETPLCGCDYCRTYCQCVEHVRMRQAEERAACAQCVANKGRIAPPHKASPRCQSGGRDHCTCPICFG